MKMKWWIVVPPLAIAAMLVTGTTGCVSEPPQSLPHAQIGTPTNSAQSSAPADPSPKPAADPSPNGSLVIKPSTPTSSSKDSQAKKTKTAEVSQTAQKPPKTWPKESRKSDSREKASTKGFVEKTEKMTSPNFGKIIKSPENTIPKPPDYSDVAKGVAMGELEAQFAEYANNNWKQSGEVLVVGEPKVEDLVIDGVTTHRVYLCLDSSSLEVTESDGFVVTPKSAPGTRTALNIYDLQEQSGQLVVANHLFPEDPNC
ncbi:hypothetical protein CQ018_14120 [Arthrobacter sp. MYb227]|uniref:hypothetical protein n=1 Tax=Arthrobacter sp. MYb227 TaxID=1848601 RepID=UPI000D4980CC|nr:hypothetical protein [Arthrobacter sp. MYb227]PQZ91097.1 hypothetical protein CQ018_14120 [Arthrobacter sp. MYb227]